MVQRGDLRSSVPPAGQNAAAAGSGLLLALLLTFMCVPASAAEGDDDWNVWAWNALNESIPVKPLDDPANPWLGLYSELDLWVIENYDPGMTPQAAQGWYKAMWHWPREQQPASAPEQGGEPQPELLSLKVSPEGFVIPRDEAYKQYEKRSRLRDWIEQLPRNSPADFHVYGLGEMPEELAETRWSVVAPPQPEVPPIPAWLAEKPPISCGFSAEGDVLVYGLLGLGRADEETPPRHNISGNVRWYRYSMEGELLGSFLADNRGMLPLIEAYWQGPRPEERHPPGEGQPMLHFYGPVVFAVERSGAYDGIWNKDAPTVLAAYDYKGNALDINAPYDVDLRVANQLLSAAELTSRWQEQLAAGLASRDSVSAFEGLPNGPQRFVGRPPGGRRTADLPSDDKPRFEMRWTKKESIFLGDLDDPANPWRGQYDAIDLWIFENINRHEMNEQLARPMDQGLYRLRDLLIAEAQQAGMQREEFYATYGEHPAVNSNSGWDPNDRSPDWRTQLGFASPEGFMIPLRIARREQLLTPRSNIATADGQPRNPGPTYATIYAGGRMSDEEYERQMNQISAYTADLWPQIPHWLHDAPPLWAVYGPGGEWITAGPLGSGAAQDKLNERIEQWQSGGRLMYRYSPEGELIGSTAVTTDNWMELYAPELVPLLYQKYSDKQRYSVTNWYGYLAVQEVVREELPPAITDGLGQVLEAKLIELYDFRGNPLPLDTELQRMDWTGSQFYPNDIRRLYKAQQTVAAGSSGLSATAGE